MEHRTSAGESSVKRGPYADIGGSYAPGSDAIPTRTPARPQAALVPGQALFSWPEPAPVVQPPRHAGRVVLAIASVTVGLAGALLLRWPPARTPAEVAIGFGLTLAIAIGYAVAGSGAMWIFALLRRWAFAGRTPRMDRDAAMLVGAAWPLALVYALTVYVVQGFIERLF
jgi:hypothetical protein